MKNTKSILYLGNRLFRRIMTVLLCTFISLNLMAQKTTITGQVVDSKNEPVIGATIMIKGTSTGTVSDNNGYYSVLTFPQ